MAVPTDSLWLVKFGLEVIKKNKAVVKELGVLQKSVRDKRVSRPVVAEEFTKLKISVPASDALDAKLTESNKLREATRAGVASLKDQVPRTDTKRTDSD